MSTIKDVANVTGLSLSTISKYLNGGNVRPENQTAIQNAIEQLDYRVNTFARGLKSNRSRTIGILLPTFSSGFFSKIIHESDKILKKQGYNYIVCSFDFDVEDEKAKLHFLVSNRVDGILFVSEGLSANDINSIMNNSEIPIVCIDRLVEDLACDTVVVDNIGAMYSSMEYLIERNHRRIGAILGPKDIYTAAQRLTGYCRALEDYGIPFDENLVRYGDYTMESGYHMFNYLMDLPESPTAICATNYDMTYGAIVAAKEQNIELSSDVEFIGFDNVEICKIVTPPLSVIQQPIKQMGSTATQFLLDRISGNDSPPRFLRLKATLIPGDELNKTRAVF